MQYIKAYNHSLRQNISSAMAMKPQQKESANTYSVSCEKPCEKENGSNIK